MRKKRAQEGVRSSMRLKGTKRSRKAVPRLSKRSRVGRTWVNMGTDGSGQSAVSFTQKRDADTHPGSEKTDMAPVKDSVEEAGQADGVYTDEDSNQIMPVGRFFGNLELVQEYPPRVPLAVPISRREYRRLHYIAPDDSDEEAQEDGHRAAIQQDDRQCKKTRKNGLF